MQCRGLRATVENSALSYVDSRFTRALLLLVAPVCREGRGESVSQRLLRRERENSVNSTCVSDFLLLVAERVTRAMCVGREGERQVDEDNCRRGLVVTRGPAWEWGEQVYGREGLHAPRSGVTVSMILTLIGTGRRPGWRGSGPAAILHRESVQTHAGDFCGCGGGSALPQPGST